MDGSDKDLVIRLRKSSRSDEYSASKVASGSNVTIEQLVERDRLQPFDETPATRRRRRRISHACACLDRPSTRADGRLEARRRARSSVAALTMASLALFATTASATPTAIRTDSQASDRRMRIQPTRRKRATIPPKVVQVDGQLVPQDWTFRGRGPDELGVPITALETLAAATTTADAAGGDEQSAGHLLAAAASATTADGPTATATFTIPSGWTRPSRETSFYAVPVILGLSVLVACLIVGAIFSSVVWRRSIKRNAAEGPEGTAEKGATKMQRAIEAFRAARAARKAAEGSAKGSASNESTGGSGTAGSGSGSRAMRSIIARSTSIVANGPRRRRRRRTAQPRVIRESMPVDDANIDLDDDEQALTATTSTRENVAQETLTSRLSRRSRNQAPSSPTVVFSNRPALDRADSGASLRLPRSPSLHSSRSVEVEQEEERASIRFASENVPSTSTARPSSSSFSSGYPPHIVLPAPGPPAYRPSSTTVRSTTRFTPSPLRTSGPSTPQAQQQDDGWHWPNEKVPLMAASPSSSSRGAFTERQSASTAQNSPPAAAESEESSDNAGPFDDSEYAAHVATDDKQVLEQLLSRRHDAPIAKDYADLPATAPTLEDEYDEDGYERYSDERTDESSSAAASSSQSTSSRALLPEPPRPLSSSFSPGAPLQTATSSTSTRIVPKEMEHADATTLDLPAYQMSGSTRADPLLAMASAPPAFLDDGDTHEDHDSDNGHEV